MRRLLILLFALPLFAKELVLVSILPQKYFIEQIAGDSVAVEVLIPKGASPATYSLKPSTLQKIKQATLYFTIGVPFEQMWMDRIKSANPNLGIVDCGAYTRRFPLSHEGHHHLDPHIWLAPNYVIQITRKIAESLSLQNPKKSALYLRNYQKFAARVAAIDSKIFSMRLASSKSAFLVYHPSFGYFARVYHLRQLAIEHEGKEPKPKELLALVRKAKALGISTIFIEPQFPTKSAQLLARRIGAKVVVIDPLAYDWEAHMLRIARAIFGD